MKDQTTVLVVDDEPDVCEIARKMLEHEGYKVRIAMHGLDALRVLDSGETIDCVVTDLVMPDMGGITLAMKLHDTRPTLPIVVISGQVDLNAASIQALAPLMNSETSCLLKKPFDWEQLISAVRRALSRAGDRPDKSSGATHSA
jgi:DNA-binding NtrC family response regulator